MLRLRSKNVSKYCLHSILYPNIMQVQVFMDNIDHVVLYRPVSQVKITASVTVYRLFYVYCIVSLAFVQMKKALVLASYYHTEYNYGSFISGLLLKFEKSCMLVSSLDCYFKKITLKENNALIEFTDILTQKKTKIVGFCT